MQSQTNVQSEAPFDGSTNYKLDFVGHQAQMTKSMRPLERGLKSTDPFDDSTVYKDNFKVYPLEAKQLKEKVQWEPNSIPLDDLSSYKKDFTAKVKLENASPLMVMTALYSQSINFSNFAP